MTSKHNHTINKHKQTALETYQVLVNASKDNQEIILKQASECIFAPQSTGFSKDNLPTTPSAQSFIGLLDKTTSG